MFVCVASENKTLTGHWELIGSTLKVELSLILFLVAERQSGDPVFFLYYWHIGDKSSSILLLHSNHSRSRVG